MKIKFPTQISARPFGPFAVILLVFGFLLACVPKSTAATIPDFTPTGAPRTTVDFTGLTNEDSISTLGWTTATYTGLYKGADARQPGSAPNGRVVQVSGTGNSQNVTGPAFTSPFSAEETVYLQGSINRISSISSGARVAVRFGTTNVAGFGIVNSGPNPFTMWADGKWITSSEVASANKWYDFRLVIDVNTTDITLTVGHLFVRNLTDGETEFRLIEDLSNIKMGFTSEINMSAITNWRIENARNDVQIGNLIGGVGTLVIPEPNAAALLGLAILAGCTPRLRRFFRRA